MRDIPTVVMTVLGLLSIGVIIYIRYLAGEPQAVWFVGLFG